MFRSYGDITIAGGYFKRVLLKVCKCTYCANLQRIISLMFNLFFSCPSVSFFALEYFSLEWSCHDCRWRTAQHLDLYSAIVVIFGAMQEGLYFLQLFCSPIRYTMYLQCIFGHFGLVAGRTPEVIVQRLGLARSPTAVNYFCHASMPGGCLMSEKSSVDFRSILISQGLDLRCYGHRSDIRRYKTFIGHGWIANESDRWRYPNILTPVSFSNHLSDATWEPRPSHDEGGVRPATSAKWQNTTSKVHLYLIAKQCD